MTTDGASPRPPEGRNTSPDPSWTPKEPNRPLLPKPGAFGVSKTFPTPESGTTQFPNGSQINWGRGEDIHGVPPPPEATNGPETP